MKTLSTRVLVILLLIGFLFILLISSSPSTAAPEAVPEPVVRTSLDIWTMDDTFVFWVDQCVPILLTSAQDDESILRRKSLAGGSIRTLDSDAFCNKYGTMAADETGLYYFVNGSPGSIFHHGPGATDTPTSLVASAGTNVDNIVLDADYVYWASSDKIFRAPKTGGSSQIIIDADGNKIVDIAVDGGSIYWLEFFGAFGWAPNKKCASPPCDKEIFPGVKGDHLLPGDPVFAGDPPFMYYVDRDSQQVRRIQCRKTSHQCSFTVVHDAPTGWRVRGIARTCIVERFQICLGDTHVFLVETKNSGPGSRVVRAALSGGSDEIGIGKSFLEGVYLDSGYVYYAEAASGDAGVYRLPFDASAIERDLKVAGMEVTQAVQNLNNDVPLVAAKTTYVRVFGEQLKGPRAMSVEAWLYGERHDGPLADSPLRPINGPLELRTGVDFDRRREEEGWLFKLPKSWTLTNELKLTAMVDPREAYADVERDNNELMDTIPVTGEPDACLFFSPVRTDTPLPSYNDPNFWETVDRYVSMHPMPGADIRWFGEPIEELETCWYGIVPYPCWRPYELDQGWDWDNWFADRDRVMAKLITRQAVARVEAPFQCLVGASVHSVGMVHPDASTTESGYANLFFNASWTQFPGHSLMLTFERWNWPDAGSTLAQELTHNFWRKHVDCGDPEGIDDNYPYEPCKLDDRALDAAVTHYGFDSIYQKVISPNEAADFMSYASNTWVSDYTYKAVKGEFGQLLQDVLVQGGAVAELAAAEEAVIISGFYEPNMELGRLNYAYTMDMTVLSLDNLAPLAAPKWDSNNARPLHVGTEDKPLPGRLVIKNDAGDILEDRAIEFIPNDDHSFETDGFFFAASFPAPAEPVALVQTLVGGEVVAEMKPGSGVPEVEIVAPLAGAQLNQPFNVRWRAADPDADVLLYHVHYSPDEGQNWFPLVTDYPGTFGSDEVSLNLQFPENVPGSHGAHALIRVTASDGFNSQAAVSGLFTTADKSPLAFISTPTDRQYFDAGETIPLQGAAYDPEEGSLPGEDFVWSVNGNNIGSGASTAVEGIQPGAHQATLTVEDRKKNEAMATTNFTVLPLQIPFSNNSPALDGRCNDSRYTSAKSLRLSPYIESGGQATVHLLRTSTDLWACFAGLDPALKGQPAMAALLLDDDYSQDSDPQSKDTLYGILSEGSPFVATRLGGSGFFAPAALPAGYSAKISVENKSLWEAEMRIPAGLIDGWGGEVALGLMGTRAQSGKSDVGYWPHLPVAYLPDDATLWAHTILAEVPILDGVQPQAGTVGKEELTLTLTGRNFGEEAAVLWDGQAVPTTRTSDTELIASVGRPRLTASGSFSLTVKLDDLQAFPSNARSVSLLNPQPEITSLSPDKVDAGSPGFTLVVKGQDFVSGAEIMWDGAQVATTFVSPAELRGGITVGHLSLGGNISISVRNPDPAHGVSQAAFFRVEPSETAGPYPRH